ncbi:hypothetical protein OH76DRAFT_215297 [Lentinus brumalis]|uniref:Uncharacterized protein n=1 Tax=Lentinus brumalis TaxID=2498619 RepID=A0A371CMK6_9APHY|nr:hypothetical protein OH76DRAFT_215297 [Polyporus brumalis]
MCHLTPRRRGPRVLLGAQKPFNVVCFLNWMTYLLHLQCTVQAARGLVHSTAFVPDIDGDNEHFSENHSAAPSPDASYLPTRSRWTLADSFPQAVLEQKRVNKPK